MRNYQSAEQRSFTKVMIPISTFKYLLKSFFAPAVIFLAFSSNINAEGFKNKDFLKLKDDQKKMWLFSAIDTLGFVAVHKDKVQGRCVWEWYHKDVATKNGIILSFMEKYPDETPSAILIALTEKDCGAYVRGNQ